MAGRDGGRSRPTPRSGRRCTRPPPRGWSSRATSSTWTASGSGCCCSGPRRRAHRAHGQRSGRLFGGDVLLAEIHPTLGAGRTPPPIRWAPILRTLGEIDRMAPTASSPAMARDRRCHTAHGRVCEHHAERLDAHVAALRTGASSAYDVAGMSGPATSRLPRAALRAGGGARTWSGWRRRGGPSRWRRLGGATQQRGLTALLQLESKPEPDAVERPQPQAAPALVAVGRGRARGA